MARVLTTINELVLTPPDGCEPLGYALVLTFKDTNNEAVYEALITVMRLTRGISVTSLKVYCDSQMVVSQVKGEYTAKEKK